jgi:hypothetical protein
MHGSCGVLKRLVLDAAAASLLIAMVVNLQLQVMLRPSILSDMRLWRPLTL